MQVSVPVQGILTNVPTLDPSQCQVCQDMPYTYATKSEDIEKCKAQGGFITIAAKKLGNKNLALVAGLYSSDLQVTSSIFSATGPTNGAFWYYVPGKSIGFSNSSGIYLESADKGGGENSTCDLRLSWHLDMGVGGWRAGCETGLNDDATWRKIIYSCDAQVRERKSSLLHIVKHNEPSQMTSCRLPSQAWENKHR